MRTLFGALPRGLRKQENHRAGGSGGLHQGKQPRRTRIARVKTMSEAGNVASPCVDERLDFSPHGMCELGLAVRTAVHARCDGIIKRDALLAGPTMHVA